MIHEVDMDDMTIENHLHRDGLLLLARARIQESVKYAKFRGKYYFYSSFDLMKYDNMIIVNDMRPLGIRCKCTIVNYNFQCVYCKHWQHVTVRSV